MSECYSSLAQISIAVPELAENPFGPSQLGSKSATLVVYYQMTRP